LKIQVENVTIFGLSLRSPHNVQICGIYGIMFQRYQLTEYYRAYFNNMNSPLFSKLCMLPWEDAALGRCCLGKMLPWEDAALGRGSTFLAVVASSIVDNVLFSLRTCVTN
jgi:hypothetical protein